MEDVAREAGVSRALVSLVVRGSPKVSEERRARVLAAATQLGYRPNGWARGLASRRTRMIGVLLNELHNPFYAEIMDGIDAGATEAGYRVLLGTAGSRAGGERTALETFLELRADGAILVGPRLPGAAIAQIASSLPVVVVARGMRSPAVDSITNDERRGARLVVEHLVGLGHRAIAHVDGGGGAGAPARRLGYQEAMREAGLAREIRIVPGDYTDLAGAAAADVMLRSRRVPTAVFAANDLVAAAMIDRFESAGLGVPADISIVGHDNTFLAGLHHISLTTVDQPRPEMGRRAMALLVERMDHARTRAVNVKVTPSLVVRSTTAPPRSATESGVDLVTNSGR
jgi:DNA-binding LacI/PurR family transcriptional regulator